MKGCGTWAYDPTAKNKYKYTENKEPHYTESYLNGQSKIIVECVHTPSLPPISGARYDRGFMPRSRMLLPGMDLRIVLTSHNSSRRARRLQAELLKAAGYSGPIKAGEVKALKNLLGKLGKLDHVVHGWILKVRKNNCGYQRMMLHGPCYLFKSPIPGLDFKDFIMLARMYRDGGSLRNAVTELLKRIPAELKTEAETFRTIDVLAGLGETA